MHTGKCLKTLNVEKGRVVSVAISLDQIASGNILQIYNNNKYLIIKIIFYL